MKTQASDAAPVTAVREQFIAHKRPAPYNETIAIYDVSLDPRLPVKYCDESEDAKQIVTRWNAGKIPTAEAERIESLHTLRGLLKPGDTVHTILRHVSRSGMMRRISPVIARDGSPLDISWDVARVLRDPIKGRAGWVQDVGISVPGCGMDMGFHLVESLSYTLFPEYHCLGKDGKCPSNYHVNHRDRVRCNGIGTGDDWQPCFSSSTLRFQSEIDMCDCENCAVCGGLKVICAKCHMCTRCHEHRSGCEGCLGTITVEGRHMYVIRTPRYGDDVIETVCPTCKGEGYIDNPAGPERWNLLHTDGYALRHRWL